MSRVILFCYDAHHASPFFVEKRKTNKLICCFNDCYSDLLIEICFVFRLPVVQSGFGHSTSIPQAKVEQNSY